MKPWNHPGKKHARRLRAQAREGIEVDWQGMQHADTRFRVGRAHRDAQGQITGTPVGFPKTAREGRHPSVHIHPSMRSGGGS